MMAANHQVLSKMLLLITLWGHLVKAQSNGDLRLVTGSSHKYYITGRLKIYLDGEWGTFCIKNFVTKAGDTACRQLGYAVLFEISKANDTIIANGIPRASNSTPIHVVSDMDYCHSSCSQDVDLHILRCLPYLDDHEDPSCTHDIDVIITCSLPIDEDDCYRYDSQLFLNSEALNSTYRSSGVLEIYSSGLGAAVYGWSNICGTNFDQNAANSACRQLGYTDALSYNTSASRSRDNDIWLDGVTCGSHAWRCLDTCFCYQRSPTIVQCDPKNFIALTCTYDLDKQDLYSAGSRWECEEEKKKFCAPTESPALIDKPLIILGTVLSSILVVLSLVIVGLICYLRRRAQYQTIN